MRLLLGRRRWLRQVFLQQRLRNNQHDEGQEKDEKEPALAAWFLLWILKFGQSFLSPSWVKAQSSKTTFAVCLKAYLPRITA